MGTNVFLVAYYACVHGNYIPIWINFEDHQNPFPKLGQFGVSQFWVHNSWEV
jgi:uncharacterized membrane protein